MSVFAQYVPHTFARGDWDARRDEVKELAIRSIARYCDNMPGAILDVQVLGPPDIEREVGLTGGHIFQGECLPPYMWDKRLTPRTPMPGVFLCGACTHPGGSVRSRSIAATLADGDLWRGNHEDSGIDLAAFMSADFLGARERERMSGAIFEAESRHDVGVPYRAPA